MSCSTALEIFINKYLIAYRDALSELPRYYALGEDSACIQGQLDDDLDKAVFFTPFKRKTCADFHNVEHALALSLHADINLFYGQFYSAPLMFTSEWGEGELLQAWNQQDFEYLQQNIIGHLMMKKKLKQPPTWFIGVLGDGDQMLTVDNETGAVCIEIPGEKPSQKLADSLEVFLTSITPRITPPVKPDTSEDAEWQHPGIWQRIKLMWQYLLRKK
ncbi:MULTISPECIES: SecY-interacting protein [Pseudomonadati]|uniref:Protein Syd n=1 Tax=Shewanella aestuarii TaxID=1028752 RepID=A0ABT0KVZ2_9GAMM|nr:SecY-interacting protein [Shewanella aestuarii]MCL1115641.1 SecY-interacting protein [Shewanella aestuarii]GGN68066.1 protein Syd [Shewanella aestuarii]